MTDNENIVAWLVPAAHCSPSDQATVMPENFFRSIPISSVPHLGSQITSLADSQPQRALQISLDQNPMRPGRFVLGTDPRTCDITLPPLPGVARQHCSLGFDENSHLVLRDTSLHGTQVWYGWECSGDKTGHTWILDHGDPTQPVTVDIQGLRFRVVLNDSLRRDREAYEAKVAKFSQRPSWTHLLTPGWDRDSVAPILPLFAAEPLFRHILVKGVRENEHRGEVYLWNVAKPWEPMTKATA